MSCSEHDRAQERTCTGSRAPLQGAAKDITGSLTPLPPTPIKLGAQHTISSGVIRGRLVVSPFKAGGFLIGLYRLDSAQLADMKPHETRPCQGVLATRNPMLPRRPAGPYTPRFEARSVSLP